MKTCFEAEARYNSGEREQGRIQRPAIQGLVAGNWPASLIGFQKPPVFLKLADSLQCALYESIRSTSLRPAKPPGDKCPQESDRETCPLTCKYNHFESEDLTIHAWELKCPDCGWRDTIGFRSDEEEEETDETIDPSQCPFCKQCELATGRDPCDKKCD